MKRLALACLSGCVTMAIVACSGTNTVTSSPSPTAKVTVTPDSGPSGPSSPAARPAEENVAAAATSYYRAVAGKNYRLAFTYLAANATGPDGRRLTFQAFLQLAHAMESLAGPVTTFSVGAYKSLVVMTIERKKIGPYHAHLQLARRGGSWTIISIDRV
jgi:hypothetical protein